MTKTLTVLQRNILALSALFALSLIGILFMLPASVHAASIDRQLDPGDNNASVTILQTYLALDTSIYPEGLVTGFYGVLTTSAVQRFQCAYSIICTGSVVTTGYGRVGPTTLASLNSKMGGVPSADTQVPLISSVGVSTGVNTANISWNTNQMTQGVVRYSTSPIVLSEGNGISGSVGVSGNTASTDSSFRASQNILISNLQRNTQYYYVVHTTNAAGHVSITWPATFTTQP